MFTIGKVATAGVWVWAIAGTVAPDAVPGGEHAWKVGAGLLGAHILEVPIYLKTFQRAGGSMSGHVGQTLVFGVFHWLSVREQLSAQATA